MYAPRQASNKYEIALPENRFPMGQRVDDQLKKLKLKVRICALYLRVHGSTEEVESNCMELWCAYRPALKRQRALGLKQRVEFVELWNLQRTWTAI